MNRPRVVKLGSISSQVAGYAYRQIVFVVMSDRSQTSSPLFVSIGKDPAERLARSYRAGREPATFKTANVRQGYLSASDEVTLLATHR